MAGYNVDENLTPVLSTAMHSCFMSHLLVLVLLQLVLTTILRRINNFAMNRHAEFECEHNFTVITQDLRIELQTVDVIGPGQVPVVSQ